MQKPKQLQKALTGRVPLLRKNLLAGPVRFLSQAGCLRQRFQSKQRAILWKSILHDEWA